MINPKLNPFSRSGVDLTNGQKIYFDLKGRKVLILTVNESIHHGSRIDVDNLIEKALNKQRVGLQLNFLLNQNST